MLNFGSKALGSPNRNLLSSPEISSMSSFSRSKSVLFRFSAIRSGLTLLGMTMNPRWVAHRKRIWPGVRECLEASLVMMGWVKRGSTCLTVGTSSSTQLSNVASDVLH
jgi:hypothetical protein